MQLLSKDVTAFMLRFAESKAALINANREAVQAVEIGSILTISTLSSQTLTQNAIVRLMKGLAHIELAIKAILLHRNSAIQEFEALISSKGLASPKLYIQHFETRVVHELMLEAEELKALLYLFQKAESVASFIQDQRKDVDFDEVDIIFSDPDTGTVYLSLISEYQEAQILLRRAVEIREAFLIHNINKLST